MPRMLKSIITVTLLSAVLCAIAFFIMWDHYQVNRDFRQLKRLLTDVRLKAVRQHKVLVTKFIGKTISVTNHNTGAVIETLALPTLNQVNYDTTLGKDMIVFYERGTGKYNKRIHGGDIRLKSYLGFRKNIVVRCTGLALEGLYPEEDDK